MGFSVSLDWEIYVYVAYCATVLNVEGWLCDDDTEHVQPNRMFWAIVISSCFFSLDSFFFEEASEIPRKLSKTIKNMPSSFHTSISHSRRDRFGFSILVHSVLIGWTWCDLSLFPHFTSLFSCSLHFFLACFPCRHCRNVAYYSPMPIRLLPWNQIDRLATYDDNNNNAWENVLCTCYSPFRSCGRKKYEEQTEIRNVRCRSFRHDWNARSGMYSRAHYR